MRHRLLLTLALASLPLVLGYTAHLPSTQMLVTIDGFSGSSIEPIPLDDLAEAAGRDDLDLWQPFPLTVVSVVSPHEFVIRGRYGLERARPWLTVDVAARLARMAPWRDELIELLAKRLEGATFYEHSFIGSPLVTSEGLRLVPMWASDGTWAWRVIAVQLEEFERTHEAGPCDPELVPLTPGDELLRDTFGEAVALAERWSDFRAPPDLSVALIQRSELPQLSATVRESVRSMFGSCTVPEDDSIEFDPSWFAVSLPDGRILVDCDREWTPLVLRYLLLHELMHQHQYTLCRTAGVVACGVPSQLRQGHASLLAREILRNAGASDESLDLIQEWDGSSGGVQELDDFRKRLGLSPDQAFAWLALHPREASALESERGFPNTGCDARDRGLAGSQPLEFEVHTIPGGRTAAVTIINPDSRPFSGFFNGGWHLQRGSFTTGPAFWLRLPPYGRVVLDPGLGAEDGDHVHPVYRETPAPVFDG
jgi:hypothetical protein